jgi:peptide-methionine (S)-S-oxide reductase
MMMKRIAAVTAGLVALVAVLAHLNAPTQASAAAAATAAPKGAEQLVLAGGCFWGMEAVFEQLKGVSNVVAGYSGGSADAAHYDMVSTGDTGHAESVEITFDPSQISLDQLFGVFFLVAHDPTELDRQGPDDGTQYRSVIFYANDAQKAAADAYVKRLTDAKTFSSPIVTQIVPFKAFYPAEAYHQHFVQRNPDYPYVVFNDLPKLKHLREQFPDLVKK